MRLVRRPLAVLVAVFATLAVLLTGCSDDPDAGPTAAPVTPTPAAAPPAAPRVGACHQLSLRAASEPSSTARPVPCTKRHTAQTYYVGRIDPVEDGHLVALDSRRVLAQLADSCPRRLQRHLGGDDQALRLSRLQSVWFSPTVQQAGRGATWFRCDVIALAGDDQLLPLPRHTRGLLDDPQALDRYGTCGTAAPGSRRFAKVACVRKHTWRAVAAVDLIRHARYLGKKATAAADDACHDVASERASDELRFTWSFEWPNKQLWAAGQRWGWCWVPTKREAKNALD